MNTNNTERPRSKVIICYERRLWKTHLFARKSAVASKVCENSFDSAICLFPCRVFRQPIYCTFRRASLCILHFSYNSYAAGCCERVCVRSDGWPYQQQLPRIHSYTYVGRSNSYMCSITSGTQSGKAIFSICTRTHL